MNTHQPDQYQDMKQTIRFKLDEVRERVKEHHHADFHYREAVVDALAAQCVKEDREVYEIDHVIEKSILADMASIFLIRSMQASPIKSVSVFVDKKSQQFLCIVA